MGNLPQSEKDMARDARNNQWVLTVLIVVATGTHVCHAQAQDETWRVVICGGILQNAEANEAQARTMTGLFTFFTDHLGIDREDVSMVCDRESPAFDANTVACTRESLQRMLENLASNDPPAGRFVFYYVGQANHAGATLRLNVQGQDITHDELARWLGAVNARQKLIILDCPCAGLAIKDLVDPNHIVVCSARGDQYDSPRFSEYFVPALLQWPAAKDAGNRLSLLDAFQTTSRELDAYYASENCYKSENALLEDDGDGVPSQQPWQFQQSGKDGAQAARFYFRKVPKAPSPGDQ